MNLSMRSGATIIIAFLLCEVLWMRSASAQEPSPSPEPEERDAGSASQSPTDEQIAPATSPPAPPPPVAPPAEPPQQRVDEKEQMPPLSFLPMPEDSLIDPRMARSWGLAPARWFLATTVDVGFIYTRPRLSAGYGRPFTSWFGLDVNPIASGQGLGAYGGLRLEIPFVDLRVGARYFSAFTRTYLAPQPSYDRLALESDSGAGAARVVTLESELDVSIPLGPGNILGRASGSYLMNVPDGMYVFEETLRVIVKPPIVWRGRVGYAVRFGGYQQHSIGFVVDRLDVPARDDYRTLRAGPIIRFVLSRRVELRGSFVVTFISPDRIGLRGGDFTELGIRYRWATE